MMQQYHDAKASCGDALLFFRMGDFYELFHEDAKIAHKALGLTLTSRDKGENPVPMAGFPYHQLDGYLAKLISAGLRAAVCEQVEDPKDAVGIVRREITRLVTPGAITDDALLDPQQPNYLAAVVSHVTRKKNDPPLVGLAWADLSTGRFSAGVFPREQLCDQLARVGPVEVLVAESESTLTDSVDDRAILSKRPDWAFSYEASEKMLCTHFEAKTLQGFGFTDEDSAAIRAAGAVLDYLKESQKTALDHFRRLTPYRIGGSLEIDEATRRSLELTRTIRDGKRAGSLLAVIDRTVTAMGSRLLAEWLANPLTEAAAINDRLGAVEELIQNASLRDDLRRELKEIHDLPRLLARVATGRTSPRDLAYVGATLARLPKLKAKLTARQSSLLQTLEEDLDLCAELRSRLENAFTDDCPLHARDGGFIRTGYSTPLDELRNLAVGGKEWIAKYQAQQSAETGIPSLKVGFNKVFGYYLEVTNAHKDKVPEHFIRKQTLKNAERYITPELKEYEEKVLDADEKAKSLEYDLFCELRDEVQTATKRLFATAEILAQVDVLGSLAELASQRDYCRPTLTDEPNLEIIDGRHPVLDVTEPAGAFVPNDSQLGGEEGPLRLITGPNMAGKSTYIRQVALIVIMGQMGSFVPARKAVIGLADRVFARVGASDELSRGQSTFMVEMTETARILNLATKKSLVILDEIGRGTSTYDGVSLAWAICEHLHDVIGCRTLFATHYHELTELATSLAGASNLNVAVKEWDDNVVFLHKILSGSADKSYGIHVARLAGVPREVNDRAKQILSQLESGHRDQYDRSRLTRRGETADVQLSLFGPEDHPIVAELGETDIDQLTPMQALEKLQQWKARLK